MFQGGIWKNPFRISSTSLGVAASILPACCFILSFSGNLRRLVFYLAWSSTYEIPTHLDAHSSGCGDSAVRGPFKLETSLKRPARPWRLIRPDCASLIVNWTIMDRPTVAVETVDINCTRFANQNGDNKSQLAWLKTWINTSLWREKAINNRLYQI
jgi:hypothetical protein